MSCFCWQNSPELSKHLLYKASGCSGSPKEGGAHPVRIHVKKQKVTLEQLQQVEWKVKILSNLCHHHSSYGVLKEKQGGCQEISTYQCWTEPSQGNLVKEFCSDCSWVLSTTHLLPEESMFNMCHQSSSITWWPVRRTTFTRLTKESQTCLKKFRTFMTLRWRRFPQRWPLKSSLEPRNIFLWYHTSVFTGHK